MKTLSNLKLFIKRMINYKVPGKYSKIRSNDVFLVSYPKSGNTWMRFIIGNLLNKEKVDFNNFNDIVPDIYSTYKSELDSFQGRRIIKSHEPYTKGYPKVIYIYRDPRDVVISYYFWNKKYIKKFNYSVSEFIDEFIVGDNLNYGSWENHLMSWLNAKEKMGEELLILRYEDLKENTFKVVSQVSEFLELNCNDIEIRRAIENSTFDSMQKLEKKQRNTSPYLKGSDKTINFVRSGKSDWTNYFTEDLKKRFKSKYGEILIKLGYENDQNW